jgi:small-conductance mechanosensitive channel
VSEAPEPAVQPPVVEERRRMPDRRQGGRRREDRSFYLRTAAAAAVAICGGLAIVYLFFAAFGAIDIEEALVATSVAVVMGLVWLGGYLVRHRQAAGAQTAVSDRVDRERRGF